MSFKRKLNYWRWRKLNSNQDETSNNLIIYVWPFKNLSQVCLWAEWVHWSITKSSKQNFQCAFLVKALRKPDLEQKQSTKDFPLQNIIQISRFSSKFPVWLRLREFKSLSAFVQDFSELKDNILSASIRLISINCEPFIEAPALTRSYTQEQRLDSQGSRKTFLLS